MLEGKTFGSAGESVVIEEFMEGEEASVLCFTDGNTIVPMISAQDHKRISDGDMGSEYRRHGGLCSRSGHDERIGQNRL